MADFRDYREEFNQESESESESEDYNYEESESESENYDQEDVHYHHHHHHHYHHHHYATPSLPPTPPPYSAYGPVHLPLQYNDHQAPGPSQDLEQLDSASDSDSEQLDSDNSENGSNSEQDHLPRRPIVKELKHSFKTTIYKLAQLQKETNQ